MKRAFDLVVSIVSLVVLGWLVLLLIAAVRLTSPGTGLFAQERIGRDQRRFICYKLRTMYRETPSAATHHTTSSSVTKLGRWLRRLKLDELPQLWNVLTGHMSLVGPRPCLPIQTELIEEREKRGVFRVRPGITGTAQVAGVDMSDPVRLAQIDARYAAEYSFTGDLALILRTLGGGGQGDRIIVG